MYDISEKHDCSSEARVEDAQHDSKKLSDVIPDYGKPWFKVPHIARLNLLLLVPLITSYVSGFDGSMLNGMQSVPRWQEDFNHPSGGILGLMSTTQVLGGIVGLPLAPLVSDRFGRRHPIAFGSVLTILGAAIQGGATGLGMFIAGRALIGFGGSFVAVAAAPLLAELAYPSQRPIITAIYNTSWYLGSIVAAWALPSFIQLVFVYFVPESPRWLVANDKVEQAETVLCRYHSGSDEPSELVRWEMAEISVAIKSERTQNTASYGHFFKTRGNRHRLIICVAMGFIIQWSGNGLVSYYLVPVLKNIGITDPETQNVINGILQIVNYFTAIAAALVVDRLGRRFLFLVSTAGMAVIFVIWTVLSAKNEQQNLENKSLGIGIVIMIFVFFVLYNIGMNPIPPAYLLEILPFTLRAKGFMVFSVAQFCSTIFNGFVNPVALEAIGWRYYIVFACLVVIWFLVFWFLFPETKGLSLEEVAVLFDGEEAMRQVEKQTNDEISFGRGQLPG
ncbi:hypothetical protein VUR80DRAFT_4052 [Thermomyces stellatus]